MGCSYTSSSLSDFNSYYGTNRHITNYGDPIDYDLSVWPPSAIAELQRFVKSEVQGLEERVRLFEERAKNTSTASVEDNNEMGLPLALLYLSREQKLAIEMILAGKATWTVALRKILIITFKQQVLAESCAKGRTNATSHPLDPQKLNAVKGICTWLV